MGVMEIKISEMLDNAAELIEEESNCSNMVDNGRVKEIVFRHIRRSKRKRVKQQKVAVLVAILGLSVITVGAKTLLQSAGIIGRNQEEILQPQVGISIDEYNISGYRIELDVQTDLLSSENLYENGIPIAEYISEVSVEEDIMLILQ